LLEASTDDTGTSLLLKNTGSLSVLVIPDAGWTTRVTTAPHANPTDPSSRLLNLLERGPTTPREHQALPGPRPPLSHTAESSAAHAVLGQGGAGLAAEWLSGSR
jgi:hypothetical protein